VTHVLGSLLKDASGVVDRRFFLSALLPGVLACGLAVIVFVAGRQGLGAAVREWGAASVGVRTLQVSGFLTAVALTAAGLASQRMSVLRWFEGYWTSRVGRWLAGIGRRHHRRRHARLGALVGTGDLAAYETVYLGYPPLTQPDQVMPTRLGNVLKNAELYPYTRYSIDAVLAWPRLYHLLPERFLATFSAAKADLDLMLGLSVLSILFGTASTTYVLVVGGPWSLCLACLGGSALVAYLTYRSALANAVVYGHQVRVAFDLYRDEVRKQLGDPPSHDDADEREYWQRLCLFWYRGIPRDHATTSTEAGAWEKLSRLWGGALPMRNAEASTPSPPDGTQTNTAPSGFAPSLSALTGMIMLVVGALSTVLLR
jgi:hypothetical protein